MEALCVQPVEEKGVMAKREELGKSREQDEAGMEASTSTTDEETDDDSEPEPPLVVCRKVSFADAFGLNLVSVKEFDNAEVAESEVSQANERDVAHSSEEFYISCLFSVPSSQEELDQKLEAQMVELESIELLPGTTTLRGIVRVVNLCYSKCVFARITLDRWNSYFDLLAEYVPGSSDRKTDRFTFRYTLLPPFERDGARVEFCLRYETSTGTFWANNSELNYVLFCHQKGHIKEPPMQEESSGYKSKRSCLKANRNGGAEEKTRETCSIATAAAEVEATHKAEKADRKTVNSVESLLYDDEHKPLVESIKSRHKSTRLARVQDHLSQRKQQARKVSPHASANGQKASRSTLAPWGDSARFLYKCQKTQPNKSPQVLTYHQIPLLTLDWNNDKPQQLGAPDVDDIWTGTAKMTLSKASKENTPCGNDMWETFLNGAGNTKKKETSVCNVWQDFLNGPSCRDLSGVPESVWLQTAASVSPSNDKEPQTQNAASSQGFPEFQVGTDTPTTSAACQPLSDTLLANVALNAEDHQPAEARVGSPRDDNTATHDASQRSQTNSVKDTSQEFSLEGAPPVSEHSVDSTAECRKHVVRERESAGIIGGADGSRGDEPFTSHTADLVTSSGESETTDMTAMPESPNASAGDRISQGAGLDEGLSSSGEGEVTGTAHNASDDMLAFRETIRQGTKDGARYVYSTSRQGAVERITAKYRQNKDENTEEVIFRPQKTECEISQKCGDVMQCGSQNCGNPLQETDENEIRFAQSHADGFDAKQTCEENLEENKIMALELKEDVQVFEDMEVETCTSKRPERITSASMEIIHVFNEEALQPNSSRQIDNMSIILEGCDKQSRPIQVGGEVHEPEGRSSTCDMNPSTQTPLESREKKQVSQSDHNTGRHDLTDKCNPNPSKAVEQRWTHSQEDMKGQEEDVGGEISPEAATAKENVATEDSSTEYQPERTEEGMSQEDKDERVSIGELKIDAMRELMGNVESPWGERKNAPAGLEEQELSAEVESSPHVECEKLLGRTKDAITPELVGSLEAMESVERFGEDVVRRIWEEVFGKEVEVANRDANVVDGLGCRVTDITQKDSNDAFDSGVFSLTDLPTDLNLSLCQGQEQTLVTKANDLSSEVRSYPLTTVEQTPFPSKLQTDLNSSAHLSQDLSTTSAAPSTQSSTKSAQVLGSLKDQEHYSQIKERSVARQQTARHIEDCVVACNESFNRPSHKHPSSSPEKLKESDGFVWWSLLYVLSHITRLLICILLVGGFFVIVFLYDFPAFFALYVFSVCWWFYKWKRHQVTTKKAMGR
ncbi:uncharacterized protein ppp1r3aa [Amphiprion ocellaris]|uniref:uncharacterized protein ppp1r3aa n=1 Tax=Amphiprion ocellaris TaxID=80972 RepID=UPI0024110C63|nr:uncharacterized protein ppp1r3aa [Amphiprion ocellaris]